MGQEIYIEHLISEAKNELEKTKKEKNGFVLKAVCLSFVLSMLVAAVTSCFVMKVIIFFPLSLLFIIPAVVVYSYNESQYIGC